MNQRGAPSHSAHTEAARYSRRSILRSEWMYGHGFQAPGGIAMVESFCQRLQLRPGMRVLDVGSGLGEADFHLAARYQAEVLGVDSSPVMVEIFEAIIGRRGGKSKAIGVCGT